MKIFDKSLKLSYQLLPNKPDQIFNVFSFMFDGNKLISIGKNNQNKASGSVYKLAKRFNVEKFINYPFPHAEIDCIKRVWGRHHITGKEKMVVVRIKRDGSLGIAMPCSNCHQILSALNLTKVWYSNNSGGFDDF